MSQHLGWKDVILEWVFKAALIKGLLTKAECGVRTTNKVLTTTDLMLVGSHSL